MDSADLLTSRTSDAGSDGHWELGDSPQISATAVGDGETIPGQIPLNSSGADLRRLQVKQNYSPLSVYHKHAESTGNGTKFEQEVYSCLPVITAVINEAISKACACVKGNSDGLGSAEKRKSIDRDRPQTGRGEFWLSSQVPTVMVKKNKRGRLSTCWELARQLKATT